MARIITVGGAGGGHVMFLTATCQRVKTWRVYDAVLTEGQPGLSDLQVDGEVSLEAELLDGHVSARLSLQGSVLHVTVEDAYRNTQETTLLF